MVGRVLVQLRHDTAFQEAIQLGARSKAVEQRAGVECSDPCAYCTAGGVHPRLAGHQRQLRMCS
jgi:hypothetical protein